MLHGGNCIMCHQYIFGGPHSIVSKHFEVPTWVHDACYDEELHRQFGGLHEDALDVTTTAEVEESNVPFVRHRPFFDSSSSSSVSASATEDSAINAPEVRKTCFYAYGQKRVLTYKVELPAETELVDNFISTMKDGQDQGFYAGFLTQRPPGDERSRKQKAPKKRHRSV